MILRWADRHFGRTGRWPTVNSGRVTGVPDENWNAINFALRGGYRGLPRGLSLPRFLAKYRSKRYSFHNSPLNHDLILRWADDHHRRTGRWPSGASGRIPGSRGESWAGISSALRNRRRGLSSSLSLPLLLTKHRGARLRRRDLPQLSTKVILEWAVAHHARTGKWPSSRSGPIAGTQETWKGIDLALLKGRRGLRRGLTLARLLRRELGYAIPRLSIQKILGWADEHHRRTGRWPSCLSGPIDDVPGESWRRVNFALCRGWRGLPGGSSLARLLFEQRGRASCALRPRLDLHQVLAWADAHRRRTGRFPTAESGPIHGAVGETWSSVNSALIVGNRGFRGGSSLARVLARYRVHDKGAKRPALTIAKVLRWADQHYRRTGRWPRMSDGPIEDAPCESWKNISEALFRGTRGFPGGSSLARLLHEKRGVRPYRPALNMPLILEWAEAHRRRTGKYPRAGSGAVPESPGETWQKVSVALYGGCRGLPGGMTLRRLLRQR